MYLKENTSRCFISSEVEFGYEKVENHEHALKQNTTLGGNGGFVLKSIQNRNKAKPYIKQDTRKNN